MKYEQIMDEQGLGINNENTTVYLDTQRGVLHSKLQTSRKKGNQ